jgi:cysteine synthase A
VLSKFFSCTQEIRTACADPHGAAIWSWIKNGNLDSAEGSSVTEGIGQNRITKNLEGAPIDEAFRIGDQPILEMVHYLNRKTGLFLGSSSAINVIGAYLLAKQLGPGKTIVTILCDSGARYMSKIYDAAWLKSKGLTPVAKSTEFLESV